MSILSIAQRDRLLTALFGCNYEGAERSTLHADEAIIDIAIEALAEGQVATMLIHDMTDKDVEGEVPEELVEFLDEAQVRYDAARAKLTALGIEIDGPSDNDEERPMTKPRHLASVLTVEDVFDEPARTLTAPIAPVEIRVVPNVRTCNKHKDCDAADAANRVANGEHYNALYHCHADDCEECFGQ